MRVESLTVFHRCGDLVVRGRRNSSYRDPATEEQLLGRMRFANQINLWRRFPKGFQPMFEVRRPGVSDYNMFVSHNMQSDPVYLTRHEAEKTAKASNTAEATMWTPWRGVRIMPRKRL